jgi:toxin ParE1/3/4
LLPQSFIFSRPRHERDELRPGLRILGFERRAVIAFLVNADSVTILRITLVSYIWSIVTAP